MFPSLNCFLLIALLLLLMSLAMDNVVPSSKDVTFDMIRILCKQRSGIKICHINAQSLRNKIDEFRFIFEHSGADIICVSETWYNKYVTDAMVDLSNYRIYRCDRNTPCGGVAMYVRKEIISKIITDSNSCLNSNNVEQGTNNSNPNVEHLFVEIVANGRKLLVGAVYRPNSRVDTNAFLKIIENLTVKYEDAIICGDFNSNILIENQLLNDMKSFGLVPTNNVSPTHFTLTNSTLLDIFFVSNKHKILLYDQLSAPCFSKHDLIFLDYDFKLQYIQEDKTYYDFNNINYQNLSSDMSLIDWSSIFYMPSVDNQIKFLEQNLFNVFKKSVPLKTVRQNCKKKPWFNSEIKSAIFRRDFAYKRWKLFKIPNLHEDYCKARKEVNMLIRSAKSQYYSYRFSAAAGTKKTWKAIREVGIGKQSHSVSATMDVDKINKSFTTLPNVSSNVNFYAQSLVLPYHNNNVFSFECINETEVLSSCLAIKSNAAGFDNIHPKFLKLVLPQMLPFITYVFNNIITKSTYPESWKHAKIIPIPKSNHEYRPIAILPYLSKVFERLLHQQISNYLNTNILLSNRQSGFRPKHSCVTALLDVSEEIRQSIDNGKISFLVLLDHSKAFDMVDHDVLCFKLRTMFNFSPLSTRLISSYLINRSQSVMINNKTSSVQQVFKGVPQGSILGPLLFTVYVNDLTNQLLYCNIHMYADDVQLYISSTLNNINDCIMKLNTDLDHIYNWANANGLCLNPSKSKCLIIRKRTMKELPFEPEIILNNQKIEIVSTTKNLGIVFNKTLTWSDHINAATGKTYAMLRTLWNTQYITPVNIRILLAKTYLIPTLLYGCEIFACTDSNSLKKLNSTFNAILRYVFNIRRFDPVSFYSQRLYGVSFNDLLKIKSLVLLHKIIYTHQPSYLFDRLIFSRSERTLDIRYIWYVNLVSKWQFFVESIRLWNSLPTSLQSVNNAMHFKRKLFDLYS